MVKLLILAANPPDTAKLAQDEELRAIREKIQGARYRDSIAVTERRGARHTELIESVAGLQPEIVHVSGHFLPDGRLVLADDGGESSVIDPEILGEVFATVSDSTRLVVLGGCHTERAARSIGRSVDCVVAVHGEFDDRAAVAFAPAFYGWIASGHDVQRAFDVARLALSSELRDEATRLDLTERTPGIANQLRFTGPQAQTRREPDASAPGEATQPPGDLDALLARIERTEIPWSGPITDVTALIERGKAAVVLVPRTGGSSCFVRQLRAHWQAEHPRWTVVEISARPRVGESVKDYLVRMRQLLGLDRASATGRLVACVHGWAVPDERVGALGQHLRAFGYELRSYLEDRGRERPFSLVAVGGYQLFLLRWLDGEMSVLNSADEVLLPDFTAGQIAALMQAVARGRWTQDDVETVWQLTGGHPRLVKALLRAWGCAPERGWGAASRSLEHDKGFLVHALTAAGRQADVRRALGRCLDSPEGILLRRLYPADPGYYLVYAGLVRMEGRNILLRCPAVRRLVHELLESEET